MIGFRSCSWRRRQSCVCYSVALSISCKAIVALRNGGPPVLRAFFVLESYCGEVEDAAAMVTADNVLVLKSLRKHSLFHLCRYCFPLYSYCSFPLEKVHCQNR